jgi:hypothetical protein
MVTYRLVLSVGLEEVKLILLSHVQHPEMLCPHLDLRLVEPRVLHDQLHVLWAVSQVKQWCEGHKTILGNLHQIHCLRKGWQGKARQDPALPVCVRSQSWLPNQYFIPDIVPGIWYYINVLFGIVIQRLRYCRFDVDVVEKNVEIVPYI